MAQADPFPPDRAVFSAMIPVCAAMRDDYDEPPNPHIVEANRVLMRLDSLVARDGSLEIERVLRDALEFYADLLEYKMTVSPDGEATARLQNLADRIRARLRFFKVPV